MSLNFNDCEAYCHILKKSLSVGVIIGGWRDCHREDHFTIIQVSFNIERERLCNFNVMEIPVKIHLTSPSFNSTLANVKSRIHLIHKSCKLDSKSTAKCCQKKWLREKNRREAIRRVHFHHHMWCASFHCKMKNWFFTISIYAVGWIAQVKLLLHRARVIEFSRINNSRRQSSGSINWFSTDCVAQTAYFQLKYLFWKLLSQPAPKW